MEEEAMPGQLPWYFFDVTAAIPPTTTSSPTQSPWSYFDPTIDKLLVAIIMLVIGGIGSYLIVRWNTRRELESKYDDSLRDNRLKSYQQLWRLFIDIPKYGVREKDRTYKEVWQLSVSLRYWYYNDGGIFLSECSRRN